MIGSLYIIRNDINDKVYIGKTYKTIEERFKQHIFDATKRKRDYKFYKAIRKYRPEHFHIELIDRFKAGILEQKEIEYIAKYDSFHNGYNSTLGGDGTKKSEFNEEEVIQEYLKLKSLRKMVKKFRTRDDIIKNILESNNIEIYIQPPTEFSLIVYDIDFNRVAELDSRQEVIDFLNKNHIFLNSRWVPLLKDAAKDCTTFGGFRWQNQEDVIYEDKEFNTVYDKEQYIAGKKCVEINGLWFARKRNGLKLNAKTGKLYIPKNCIQITQNGKKVLVSKRELEEFAKTMTIKQLAKKYKISVTTMSRKLHDLGIQTETMKTNISKCPSKEELEKLKHLPKVQIAKIFKVSDKTIKNWLDKYGIKSEYKQKINIPPKEELEEMLYINPSEIGEVYNVSPEIAFEWVKFYGLKLEQQNL